MDELARGQVDGDEIIRRLGGGAIACRLVFDPQLRVGNDDAQSGGGNGSGLSLCAALSLSISL